MKVSDEKGVATLFNVHVVYSYREGRNLRTYRDLQLYCAKVLPQDYGHMIIRPETLS